ncbi:hypothetical protein WME90_11565 [Sorangium sp. So ce375]|uniref:hypothetical protein n=1 Tax=Sorangium sp. So ce375 TaxID=3133306 RepID=UPI003F5BC572
MKTPLLSRSLALAGLACLAGCPKEPTAQAPSGAESAPTAQAPSGAEPAPAAQAPPGADSAPAAQAPPATDDARGAAAEPRCEADADCVVSCARAGQCCDQLCPPCNQAFHRDALAALQKWRSASCAAESCPVAKCMAPKEDSVARCKAGACVVERVPHVDR